MEFDHIDNILSPSQNPLVFGHRQAMRFLGQMREEGRLHHALLFEGLQGIGKATLAFHLAWNILSANTAGFEQPDTTSSVWHQISRSIHPGLLHIMRGYDTKTEKFRSAITVEEIRRINRFLQQTVSDNGWRVVIIDTAEDMNRNAANALLKTLEEPPARTVFVLVSHHSGRLLPTIRSRCQPLLFKPLAEADMLRALSYVAGPVGFHADNPQTPDLVQRAEGSVRQAVQILTSGGLEIAATVDDILTRPVAHVTDIQKLATALSGRDADQQWMFFMDYLGSLVARKARGSAFAGKLTQAASLSTLWQDMQQNMAQTQAYNLDKKHFIIILLQKVHTALRKLS